MVDVKIRLSVLWFFYAVALLAVMILSVFEPGTIEQLMLGQMDGVKVEPELLLAFAVLVLAPLVMGFLSVTLKDSINRWTNIIAGIVFTVIQIVALIGNLLQPTAYGILMEISKVIAPALIVWYAWKWPKQEG